MGLTVARQLVETQGGWLEMRSALGIGTEVEIWLPAPISADRLA
jgi:signal transduction histidine kinase